MGKKIRILFVSGRNKWRSPTATHFYRNDERVDVRSAGMSSKSKHQISESDIKWAELILVMENNYKSRILGLFRHMVLPKIENLDIPDKYDYMDKELIDLIRTGVEYHINLYTRK